MPAAWCALHRGDRAVSGPATPPVTIARASPATAREHLADLAHVLHAAVHAGASIGFLVPFCEAEALAFFQNSVLPLVERGERDLFIAMADGAVVGTVQLHTAMPANQPHHAGVTKLITHPHWRRRGIARALMEALEARAAGLGRTLLTLDTRTGDAAEPLYTSLGYVTVGEIPRFCRDTLTARWDATTVMYKHLGGNMIDG